MFETELKTLGLGLGLDFEEKKDLGSLDGRIEMKVLGQDFDVFRSEDVLLLGENTENVDFREFGLSEEIVRGLSQEGFEKPSPIQLNAIPIGMLGRDMLMQSKSGTGKTCVFSVIALERVTLSKKKIQVLVISPSREIAIQTQDVIKAIGTFKEGLNVVTFIGGCPIEEDLRRMDECHIAVGTPGRLSHLFRELGLDLSSLEVLILDEADKLFEDSFSVDMSLLLGATPKDVQIFAVSATFGGGIEEQVSLVLKDPVRMALDVGGPTLFGVDQFAVDVKKFYQFEPEEGQSLKLEDVARLKHKALLDILSFVPFSQAIIFSSSQLKVERIYDDLRRSSIAANLLSGALSQSLRIENFRKFQNEKSGVLVATDLAARGLDYEHVNLIINYETPLDLSTYIHRMGRSGRFGSFGRVITLLGFKSDATTLSKCQTKAKLNINLITSLEDLKNIPDQAPGREKSAAVKFLPIFRHGENPILTLGEAWEFLEKGGLEARLFAAFCCARVTSEEDEFDQHDLRKYLDDLIEEHCLKEIEESSAENFG